MRLPKNSLLLLRHKLLGFPLLFICPENVVTDSKSKARRPRAKRAVDFEGQLYFRGRDLRALHFNSDKQAIDCRDDDFPAVLECPDRATSRWNDHHW